MNDLFGQPITEAQLPAPTLAKKKRGQAKGYARPPGSGPAGETCKTCQHSYGVELRSGKRYWKCGLVKATGGPGTDIRLKSPACSKFEKPVEEKQP